MNQQEVAGLLVTAASAATGKDFFTKFCSDPKGAAQDLGLVMTDEEAAVILQYAKGMRERAERGGTHVLIHPVPTLSGPPDGTPKP